MEKSHFRWTSFWGAGQAWRRRPNHIDPADFEAASPGRMYQKVRANFLEARRAGTSIEEWRRNVGKLTKTADWAARDEVRVIIEGLRSKSNPEIRQLTYSDIATREDTNSEDDTSRPEPAQKTNAIDEITTPTRALHDSRGFVLSCVQGECRSRDQLEHFRVCEDCQTTLKTVNDCLADFVVVASVRAVNREHVSLIDDLELRSGAIQFLIACRRSQFAKKEDIDILDRNLDALGFRVPRQQRDGSHSRRRSPRREQQLEDFATTLLRASTLLVFARRDRHEMKFMDYGYLYIPPPTD